MNTAGAGTLCIYVETVEVELDEDGCLSLENLQSALPGSYGLYTRDKLKVSVKCDGKKLFPPAGGWSTTKYFTTLGCRSSNFPYATYANASQQFQQSVNAVQELFKNSQLFDYQLPNSSELTKNIGQFPELLAKLQPKPLDRQTGHLISNSQLINDVDSNYGPIPRDGSQSELGEQIYNGRHQTTLEKIESIFETEHSNSQAKHAEIEQLRNRYDNQEHEMALLTAINRELKTKNEEMVARLMNYDDLIFILKQNMNELKERNSRIESELRIMQSRRTDDYKSSEEEIMKNDHKKLMEDFELEEALSKAKAENVRLENELNVAEEKYRELNKIYHDIVTSNAKLNRTSKGNDNTLNTEIAVIDEDSKNDRLKIVESNVLREKLAIKEKKIGEFLSQIQQLVGNIMDENCKLEDISSNMFRQNFDMTETKIQITIKK